MVIDFLIDRRPFSLLAAKLFSYSEKGKVKLYIGAVSYNNIYYVLKKHSSHKATINVLRELESFTETIDTTKSAIQKALASDFKDFEDAIQYYTAISNNKLDAIITRNIADFKLSTLPVFSPDEAIGLIECP
ncbi:MAG: PIN domain-containing protein [Bacteroidia bacterium]|nr:PIN domain-containing protein [Bacteroidia bacterium]MCC6767801.1 PIN domain-containing protein [Bacteroidia bacterium]